MEHAVSYRRSSLQSLMSKVRPSTFFAGFSGLAFQIVTFKLILLAGFGDGLSLALSLTIFVTISGLGAAFVNRLHGANAGLLEVALGVYAAAVFGGIHLHGVIPSSQLLHSAPDGFELPVLLLILTPIAFLSGALLPIYDRKRAGEGRPAFPLVYALFHVGGAVSLVLIETSLFPTMGYVSTGLLLSGLSMLNGFCAMPLKMEFSPPVASTNRRAQWILVGVSVATGVLGIAVYKSFDYIVGPNIRNYTVVSSAIFAGLGISGLIVAFSRISLRTMVMLTGAGVIAFLLATQLIHSIVLDLVVYTNTPIYALYAMVAVAIAIPFALIGLSIPVCVQEGLSSSRAIFLCSIGNCFGYWLYIWTANYQIDFYLLIVPALLFLCVIPRSGLAVALGFVAIYLYSPSIQLPDGSLHHVYAEQRFTTTIRHKVRPLNEDPVTTQFEVDKSWNTWGNPVDLFAAVAKTNDEIEDVVRPYVVSGFQSLNLGDISITQFGEAASALIPTMFADTDRPALVIGAGSGISAGAAAKFFSEVDLVDLNPDTADMLEYFEDINWKAGETTNLINQDAFSFLGEAKQASKYSLVFNTATGAGYSFSSFLYTREFFEKSKESMTEDGVFALWVDGRSPLKGTASSVFNALKATFANVRAIQALPFGSNSPGFTPYMVMIASDGDLTAKGLPKVAEFLSSEIQGVSGSASNYINIFPTLEYPVERFDSNAPVASIQTLEYAYRYLTVLDLMRGMYSKADAEGFGHQ